MKILRRLLGLLIVVAIIAGAAYAVVQLTRDDEVVVEEQVIVVDEVGRATLSDTVVIRGSVVRDTRFTLVTPAAGRITRVAIEEGETINVGDVLLEMNGRPVIAADAPAPFWRPLDRRSANGPDIEMLESFLLAEGFDPGTVNTDFTNSTRTALEDWQEANGFEPDGIFQPQDLAVAEWPATPGPVDLEIGQLLQAGQPIVTFVDDDVSVIAMIDPTDRSRLEAGLNAEISVPAIGTTGDGRLIELADAATIDGQGTQRYRAEISILDDLAVVDGTAVRVEVILAQVENALVVPVAAVSLNGNGEEEVRILNEDGQIDRVTVVTGLTEGADVEVVEGLSGGEQVVVEVRVS